MKTAIVEGTLVTGDGITTIEDALVLIDGDRIVYAGERKDFERDGYKIVDATGNVVIPGVINAHAHGFIPNGPLFSSGSAPLGREQVSANLRRHLAEGTTTLLSVDGLTDPDDVLEADREAAMCVRTAIAHTPKAYEAAREIDAAGIRREFTYREVLARYSQLAVAFGECGSGATLGGGVQEYKFIPEMVRREYGVQVDKATAREMKEAVLGRFIKLDAYDEGRLRRVMERNELSHIAPQEMAAKIVESVMPPFDLSLESITEALDAGREYDLPSIIHNATASMDLLDGVSSSGRYEGRMIIAAHSNHPSYTTQEAVDFARKLRARSVIIDISTFDTLSTGNETEIATFMAFLEEGVVDTVSTDYGGGNHCSILSMLSLAVRNGVIGLPQSVKLATYGPARAVPLLGQDKGLIAPGYLADIAFVDAGDISRVRQVMVGGEIVYTS